MAERCGYIYKQDGVECPFCLKGKYIPFQETECSWLGTCGRCNMMIRLPKLYWQGGNKLWPKAIEKYLELTEDEQEAIQDATL